MVVSRVLGSVLLKSVAMLGSAKSGESASIVESTQADENVRWLAGGLRDGVAQPAHATCTTTAAATAHRAIIAAPRRVQSLRWGDASAPPPHMLFDAIFVGGGVAAVPESLLGRLKPDGVMVVPVGPPGAVLRLLLVEGTQCVARVEQQVAQGICTAHEAFDVTVLREGVVCDPLPDHALDGLGLGVEARVDLEPWQY